MNLVEGALTAATQNSALRESLNAIEKKVIVAMQSVMSVEGMEALVNSMLSELPAGPSGSILRSRAAALLHKVTDGQSHLRMSELYAMASEFEALLGECRP